MTKKEIKKKFDPNYVYGYIGYLSDYKAQQKNPRKVQEKILLKIINKNKNTEYGKKYSFKSIKSINDFQKKVPIITYEDISEEIEKIKNGQKNVLTKKKVIYFALTSGTSSSAKLIPVTKNRFNYSLKEYVLWGSFLLKNYPNVIKGNTLFFSGPYFNGYTKGGIPYGSITGYLSYNTPKFITKKLSCPLKYYNILDYDTKIHEIAIHSLQKDVTQIGMSTPIEAILFFDYIQKNKTKLINELKKINPKRAKQLLSLKNFKPIEIWPNLCLVQCFKYPFNYFYLDTLIQKIGKNISIRDAGINASEGRITLCLEKDNDYGTPLPHIFYEFQEYGKKNVKPITLDKLEKNKKYVLIITTSDGLYRYNMEDIIIVKDFKNKLPLLQFYDRDKYLNIAGELSSEVSLVAVMKKVLNEQKISVTHFTFAPFVQNFKEKPRYEILIEPKTKLTDNQAKQFLKKLEETLEEDINNYREMRHEFGRLDPPVLSIVKKGEYDKLYKQKISSSSQVKYIPISKDVNFRKNFVIEKTYFL